METTEINILSHPFLQEWELKPVAIKFQVGNKNVVWLRTRKCLGER